MFLTNTPLVTAADLFCGAGGTSTGLVEGAGDAGFDVNLTAVNHWPTAVATHHANHPAARHLCASIDNINPRDLFRSATMGAGRHPNARLNLVAGARPAAPLDILWASPECTHHSVARGGRPINDQSRATAWCVIRWAEALKPHTILVENVPEFETWGPCDRRGKPLKSRKGEIFRSWVSNLRAIGYTVDWRVLCAADYGDPTTRRRLFVQAVLGRRHIVWPAPSHSDPALLNSALRTPKSAMLPWVAARDIIDWTEPGQSIYHSEKYKKRPLKPKTMRRILIGLQKFGLAPFVVPQQTGGVAARSIDKPVPTITTTTRGMGLANPFLVKLRGDNNANSVDQPAPTITASGTHLGLAEPFLVNMRGNSDAANVDAPAPTVTATGGGHLAVCQPKLDPFLVTPSHGNGGKPDDHRARSLDRPLPTVMAGKGSVGDWGVCQPFVVAWDHQGGNGNQSQSVDAPLGTVVTKQRHGVAQPYLVKFYGTADGASIDDPLDTVTSKERFGIAHPTLNSQPSTLNQPVVEIDGQRYLVDILFRMLKPRELALAQGFRPDYQFTGNTTEIVKQIGNAVPRHLARALVRAALSQKP